MSSKRKSPPTKLHEGVTASTVAALSEAPQISVSDFDRADYPNEENNHQKPLIRNNSLDHRVAFTDLEESSNNFESDLEEGRNSNTFYKVTSSSSNASSVVHSDEEIDQTLEEDVPPKKQRFDIEQETKMTNNLLVPATLSAINLHHEQLARHQAALHEAAERRRSSSECSSPSSEFKSNLSSICNNNNSTLLNHNNSPLGLGSGPQKRTMDDVLKRLTSKMNHSTIKEEKRPTPSTTPIKHG